MAHRNRANEIASSCCVRPIRQAKETAYGLFLNEKKQPTACFSA
ncbi:hypothetical protein LCGC14_2357240 [marine sediment metagenome]|uniref:Uncharacterized protein n=1 Tax=marine sediment metagenome TaxID=412755 RepID=A0A0F9EK83_9ZZZZ